MDRQSLDFISELRLRQWARRNHVPAHERIDQQWHPVVLEEMRRRDEEVVRNRPTVVTSAGVVPLIPSEHDIRIDDPHASVPEPNLNRQRIPKATLIPHCG